MTRAGRGRDWRPGRGPEAARGAAEAGEWHAGAGAGRRGSWRSWAAAVGGLVAVVLAVAIVALLLPVALFGMALSRSLFFVLAALLFGRRGLLRRLRGWLAGIRNGTSRYLNAGPSRPSSAGVQVISAGLAGLLNSSLIRPAAGPLPPAAPVSAAVSPGPWAPAAASAAAAAASVAAAVSPSRR